MKRYLKNLKIIFLALFFLAVPFLIAAIIFKSKSDPSLQRFIVDTKKSHDVTEVRKAGGISATSSSGKPVDILVTPCDSADTVSCFGDGAVSLGEIKSFFMWDLVSTSDKLYFGIMPSAGDKWPYVVGVDFKGKIYDVKEYDFFKKKLPELFLRSEDANF